MYEETLKSRLKTMYGDLTFSSKEACMLIGLLTDSIHDKDNFLRDLYFSENAPVKVLSTEDLPRGTGDATSEIIDICMGYDDYVKGIGREAYNLIDRHNKALRLFTNMLSLPFPYSQILYLRFFKDCSVDEICSEMFLSKSNFYRKFERGITLLLERLNS